MTTPRTDIPDSIWWEALRNAEKSARSDHNHVRDDLEDEIRDRKQEIHDLKELIKTLQKEIKEQFTQKIEFEPVKRGFYAAVGVMLIAVITAIVALVVKHP